jgi:hypothetical protein
MIGSENLGPGNEPSRRRTRIVAPRDFIKQLQAQHPADGLWAAENWHPNWHPTDDDGRLFDRMVTGAPNCLHVDFAYDRGLIGTIR